MIGKFIFWPIVVTFSDINAVLYDSNASKTDNFANEQNTTVYDDEMYKSLAEFEYDSVADTCIYKEYATNTTTNNVWHDMSGGVTPSTDKVI